MLFQISVQKIFELLLADTWVNGFGTTSGSIQDDFLEKEEFELFECVGGRASEREGCMQKPEGISQTRTLVEYK